jgi:hypothetical protein
MVNGLLWQLLWVLAALIAGALMFGAWTGPHRSVSNLSRWATWFGFRSLPGWLNARAADRWAFRGGLATLVLLLAVAWLVPSRRAPEAPAAVPEADTGKTVVAPPSPPNNAATPQPARHIDAELKNAILLHVPKSRQVKLVVLSGDAEANQFAWEIDAFLKSEGYQVISPHLFFMMTAGGKTPSGTTIYPDESDPNVLVIRIGLNDRDPLAAKQ